MKDFEKIVKAMELCALEDVERCEECPYIHRCQKLKADAVEMLQEMKARNYEYSVENYKLHDKLCEAEITLERIQRELSEAEQELAYLRAIKATTEAFLGVKIDEHIR